MRVKNYYVCEICNTEYETERAALHCESNKLKPCPIKVGDKVEVFHRYNEPDQTMEDIVTGISIECPFNPAILDNSDFKYRLHTHFWVIGVEHEHPMTKDEDSYTDKILISSVRFPGKDWFKAEDYHYGEITQK